MKRWLMVMLVALIAFFVALGEDGGSVQGSISIKNGANKQIVYANDVVEITITGSWESAKNDGRVITFQYPEGDYVQVECQCIDDQWDVQFDVDNHVNGGYVKYIARNRAVEEETLADSIMFKSSGTISVDLDCDANWDGGIGDDDEPLEEIYGGVVGLGKFDEIEIKIGPANAPTNGTFEICVGGGIELCIKNGDDVRVVVGAQDGEESVKKELTMAEAMQINCVRGVAGSENACDCTISLSYTLPSGEGASDIVNYTVLDTDVIIDGKGKKADEEAEMREEEQAKEEEGENGQGEGQKEGKKKISKNDAFVLYVNDFGEEPFAPRATNYLVNVELMVTPTNFVQELQEKIQAEVSGAVKDYLYTVSETVNEAGEKELSYAQALDHYNMTDLNTNKFVLHGHGVSALLRDHHIELKETTTGIKDICKFTVVKLNLIPDYDRDHTIGGIDEKEMCWNKKLRWWVNDDADKADCGSCYEDEGTDIPGQGANSGDDFVNRCTDLLDFFPVWADMKNALDIFEPYDVEFTLDNGGYGIVYTKLKTSGSSGGLKGAAGGFLFGDVKTADEKYEVKNAETDHEKERKIFDQARFVELVRRSADYGILMTEGRSEGASMKLKIRGNNRSLVEVELPVEVMSVENMYNRVHVHANEEPESSLMDEEMDSYYTAPVDVVFLHGFRVSADNARGWHSEMFKRLYQSGSNARFWGVTWDGYEDPFWASSGQFYHKMAGDVAFTTAERLGKYFKEAAMRRSVVAMAHSLGNMVVSSAICDYGWKPSQYFMLNAAVPTEAYAGRPLEPSASATAYYMIHQDWREQDDKYPAESYASNWYRLFKDDESERPWRNLTWVNRFKGIEAKTKVTSFYSSGDEVFEIKKGNVGMADGAQVISTDTNIEGQPGTWQDTTVVNSLAQYSWQKQELAKGLGMSIESPLCIVFNSKWCGWRFNRGYTRYKVVDNEVVPFGGRWYFLWMPWNSRRYSAEVAREIVAAGLQSAFRNVPAFRPRPEELFDFTNRDFAEANRDKLLGFAIPALSPAVGRPYESKSVGKAQDMDKVCEECDRCAREKPYETRWLHCDLKDMAYRHNYKLYDRFVEVGTLK